ncbi:UNVERIFIED_CONTAM: Ubiquitin carboxyl-terminal hydrolase 8 [Sesamum radiatum]|uniref:ubiquitinyl hydrolase 1 n=1 Tax=Sesamum radiatum TaxID=300843 RepID=A0AAW2W4V1_SESRA
MENDFNIDSAPAIPSSSLHYEPRQEGEEPLSSDDDQRVYLVPFRWWKEAQDSSSSEIKRGIPYAASPAPPYGGPMKIFNNIFNSDIAFNLRKEDELMSNGVNGEVGVSSRDYALVPGETWLQTLKWHSDSKSSSKEKKGFPAVEEDMSDVYPLQLRLSVLRETNVLAVKISKKLRVWDFSGQTTLLFLNDKNKILKESQKQTEQDGEIASSFGELLKKLWAPGATPLAPRTFKMKLAHFAPQFSGFNQHDSQELLAFLLDGLHEDLNRVKCKPYVEAKDSDDRPDEEVADEYWRNHLARNDSIIVDVCQGQYRSTLVCPLCKKVSVTFDPFMYLSLPLPSTSTRTMTLTVVKSDGSTKPSPFTVTVPKNGKLEDLTQALSTACSLAVDETLLLAEIYNNRIIRFLEEPTDSLSLIRDNDQLIAYRLPKDAEEAPLFVFMHQIEEHSLGGKLTPSWRAFGVPLVVRKSMANGSDIHEVYAKLVAPFLVPGEDSLDNNDGSDNTATEEIMDTDDACLTRLSGSPETSDKEEPNAQSATEFQFYLTNEKGTEKGSEIGMGELVKPTPNPERLYVLVSWSANMANRYDVKPLSSLPEVFKSGFFMKRPQESVSLYKCLEAFLKEEPLGPDDMWYCPVCKKHCQASKKLDLWRLPEILVIHLKRFSYSRFLKNKLETYVDFPTHDLDLSSYIAKKGGQSSHRYILYAISNHYGSMGGGHYTAFVHHGGDQWYDFDDSHVSPVSEDKIKTSAAYVLFYRRVEDA